MSRSLEPPKRQPVDISGNQQGIDADGFDLALLSPTQLQAYSHTKALGEAIRHDPRTDQQIARHARISKGHLSKLRSGLWEEQANRMHALLVEVGHVGPAQKLLYDLGFEVRRRKPRKAKGKT